MRRRDLVLGTAFLLTACATGIGPPAPEGPTDASLQVDRDRSPDEIITLWPDAPPGGIPEGLVEDVIERESDLGLRDRARLNITHPTLSMFHPKAPGRSSLLIIPGGGYERVVVDKEGYESARWFSLHGITTYVLSYRLPHQGWQAGPDTPLQDAQRAMRLIRDRSVAAKGEPDRIMVMGFSAGGHVAGSLATRFDADTYAPVDAADRWSARPDAATLVYPVATLRLPHTHDATRRNMLGDSPSENDLRKYSIESGPAKNAPPTLFLHASDDTAVPVENSLLAYAAFRRAGVEASLHVFSRGGHGFGLRGIDDLPVRIWPELVLHWGQAHGTFD
jgi:acetyl esterase/lipase